MVKPSVANESIKLKLHYVDYLFHLLSFSFFILRGVEGSTRKTSGKLVFNRSIRTIRNRSIRCKLQLDSGKINRAQVLIPCEAHVLHDAVLPCSQPPCPCSVST